VDPARKLCIFPNLIQARAILSWNTIPPANQPNFKPVWGDIHNTHIEVDPLQFVIVNDLFKAAKLDVPDAIAQTIDLDQTVEAKNTSLSVADKAKLYCSADVEPQRFAFAELQSHVNNPVLAASLQAGDFSEIFPELNLDLSKIGDLLAPTDGNTEVAGEV